MSDETTPTTNVSAFPTNWMIAPDFNPMDHLMSLKGKDYLNVQQRTVWFIHDQRRLIADGLAKTTYMIKTEMVELDRELGFAHFRTVVRDVLGNEAIMYGSETAKDFTDYIEKASTKATGRALAYLGYGTQFAPEMDEGERVVDAPVSHQTTQRAQQQRQEPARQAAPAVQQRQQPAQQRPVTLAARPAPVEPVPEPVVVETPAAPRIGMTPEESAHFDELIARYNDNKFISWAMREAGLVLKKNPNGPSVPARMQMTEDQIAMLFDNIEDWYSVWQIEQEAKQAEAQPAATQQEPVVEPPVQEEAPVQEAPVVDEKMRTRALQTELVQTYINDASGKPDPTLMLAAYAYLLPKVPVPAGQPTMSHTELQVEGKTISLSVVLRQHGVEFKAYNDVLEVALGDAAFIDYIIAQRAKLGLLVDKAA